MPSSLDDYEVICTIGTGSYGTCKKIRRKKDDKVLVWKEIDYGTMTESEKQMLVSEVNLLRELKHQHIVRYHDRIIDRSNTKLYIVMEYCEGGDVGSIIAKCKREVRHVTEDFVWRICTQVIMALKECHCRSKNGKAVLHRDLKPANVFLDADSNVKLGDFGLARVLQHETSFARTFVGTPYYMSPEQMTYMSYNEKSDIWSLGCMLYELCALRPPFTATNQKELATKICTGRFTRIPLRYTDELNDVIASMIKVDEHRRPTITDLYENPHVLKRMPRELERQSSSSSDSNSESLKKKEESLQTKEKELHRREQELEEREKKLQFREKIAEERIARAERLMKEYSQSKVVKGSADTNLNINSESSDYKPLQSCLKSRSSACSEDSPKKHVSFHLSEKENDNLYGNVRERLQTQETNEPPLKHETRNSLFKPEGRDPLLKHDIFKLGKDFYDYNQDYDTNYGLMYGGMDLRRRLDQARKRSEELRKAEYESKIKSRQLLAMR